MRMKRIFFNKQAIKLIKSENKNLNKTMEKINANLTEANKTSEYLSILATIMCIGFPWLIPR
jgi:hypothetical protein